MLQHSFPLESNVATFDSNGNECYDIRFNSEQNPSYHGLRWPQNGPKMAPSRHQGDPKKVLSCRRNANFAKLAVPSSERTAAAESSPKMTPRWPQGASKMATRCSEEANIRFHLNRMLQHSIPAETNVATFVSVGIECCNIRFKWKRMLRHSFQLGAKSKLSWPKMAPKWPQDGPKPASRRPQKGALV